jgi:hypothetical protein
MVKDIAKGEHQRWRGWESLHAYESQRRGVAAGRFMAIRYCTNAESLRIEIRENLDVPCPAGDRLTGAGRQPSPAPSPCR